MPKAVSSDVDGTLIGNNDPHVAAWFEKFRHFGNEVPYNDVRSQMGKGGDQLMPVFLGPNLLERHCEEISRCRAELFKRRYLPEAHAFLGARPLFERIRRAGHYEQSPLAP
jgi:phosphoglycolate phosphatase-like HAD superfamily hydrolase